MAHPSGEGCRTEDPPELLGTEAFQSLHDLHPNEASPSQGGPIGESIVLAKGDQPTGSDLPALADHSLCSCLSQPDLFGEIGFVEGEIAQ